MQVHQNTKVSQFFEHTCVIGDLYYEAKLTQENGKNKSLVINEYKKPNQFIKSIIDSDNQKNSRLDHLIAVFEEFIALVRMETSTPTLAQLRVKAIVKAEQELAQRIIAEQLKLKARIEIDE